MRQPVSNMFSAVDAGRTQLRTDLFVQYDTEPKTYSEYWNRVTPFYLAVGANTPVIFQSNWFVTAPLTSGANLKLAAPPTQRSDCEVIRSISRRHVMSQAEAVAAKQAPKRQLGFLRHFQD